MTFSRFFSYFHLLVEENQKNTFFISTIFFYSKIAQISYFYVFILIFRQYIYFSLQPKTIFILVQKKEIYAISRKKFLFTEKVNFFIIFCSFNCFHQTINKKQWIFPQYTFFLKKIINDVFFNVFRSINGILNKTLFYKYNICNLYKIENSA